MSVKYCRCTRFHFYLSATYTGKAPDLGTTIILPGLDEYCCIVRLGLYCCGYIGLGNILSILLLLRLLLDVPPQ
jgi:hypothetical protein